MSPHGGDKGQATSDQDAILALMKTETGAFLHRDFDTLRRNWIDTPQSRFLISWPGVGARVYCGLDEIVAMLSASVAESPPTGEVDDSIDRRNMSIVVSGDFAWASYDQVSRTDDPDFILNGIQHEIKIFQRIESGWKITCTVVMARTVEHLPDPLVEVARDMTVVWANAPGRSALLNHPGLSIIGNRLRVRNRRFDTGLREAVAWAHEKLFASPQKSSSGATRIRVIPLGEDDDGAPSFCWIFVEDGRVLVSFDEPGTAQLERARIVFGLSPAQMRLGRLIVQGKELAEAAGALGVSVNTARTQLNRMFDKVGVHNQAALVRRLVSLRIPTKG
jgi:DNA-binding CsgD family transcriptional regulator